MSIGDKVSMFYNAKPIIFERACEVTRIGLTRDFPLHFKAMVKDSLGESYDQFEWLEEFCKPKEGAGLKEFKEANGI